MTLKATALFPSICLALLMVSSTLSAQEENYTAEIAVKDQSPNEYATAVRMGLENVIANLQGNRIVLQRPEIQEFLGTADSYVEQYQYSRIKDPEAVKQVDITPGVEKSTEPASFILSIRFSQDVVDELTDIQGGMVSEFPVSKPALMWLVVEQGGSSELIGGDEQNPIVTRVFELAQEQGAELVFPLLDLQDRQALSAADIRGGFEDRIRKASARYDIDSIVTGVLSEQPGGMWLTTWRRIADGGNPIYTNSALNLDSVMASGVQWIVETGGIANLSENVVSDTATSGTQVWIGLIESTDHYARSIKALAAMPNVEFVEPVYLAPEGMLFSVTPRMSPSQIQKYLERVRWLRQSAPPESQGLGESVPGSAELFYDYTG